MDDPKSSSPGGSGRAQQEDRLDSWKKIASYLKRDVSTVQRWERREGMPVHRHLHDKLGSVFAFRSEIDAWWESRRARLEEDAAITPERPSQVRQSAIGGSRATAARLARPTPVWLAVVVGAVVTLGGLSWLAVGSGYLWRNPLADAKYTRLSDVAGSAKTAAISRDGRFVAFLADDGGHIDAWAGAVGGGKYRNVTHGELRDLVNPSIRTLGFSADSSLVSIWTRRADGSRPGDVSILAAPIAGGALKPYLGDAAEFDWSHDGKRLVYHTTAPGDPLYLRASGGPAGRADFRIYVAPAGVHCHFPVWSADDAFIYFVRGVPPDNWDVWRIRATGEGLERITFHNSRVAYPVVLDRRTLAYLATDADGSGPRIYALDVERRVPHRISSGLEDYTSLAASADGARLVATIANSRTSVWRVSLPSDPASPVPPASPFLVAANAATPRMASGSVVYVSARGDRQVISVVTNGAARELWSSERARVVGGPAITRDGLRIAFSVAGGDQTLLYVMDSDGSHARVLAGSLALRGNPAWAPDGQSIVTAAMRDGEPRLIRVFLNGEPLQPLVSEYSTDPVWSPDGGFVLYSGADVGTTFPLRAAAVDGRPFPLPSVQLTRGARRVAFFRDSSSVVVLGGEIGHKNFWLLDLRTGDRRMLADVPADFAIGDFDISASGSEIVFDRVQATSELALIERPR